MRWLMPPPSVPRPERYQDAERGPFTQNGLNFDRAAVHLDDTLGDRESKPAAALLACAAVVDLLELFKYFALILGRNTRPGVLDRDLEAGVRHPGADLDRAMVRKLDRVPNEVQQHLS